MQAVILAAGEGTRLRPLTASRPKVMLRVANRPILRFVVSALKDAGITDLLMVVGYGKEQIMTYFEDGRRFGVSIAYVEQDKQLGTAHALAQVRTQLKPDSPFLVLPGDNIIDARTLHPVLSGEGYALVTTRSDTPSKYGVVSGGNGEPIEAIEEKPEKFDSDMVSTGIYRLDPSIFAHLETVAAMGRNDLTSVVQHCLRRNIPVRGLPTSGRWVDAVYPWDLVTLNATALSDHTSTAAGTVESGVVLKGPISVGAGSVLRSGCYVEGPVVIGRGCDIGPHVVIAPSTAIGNNVQVGPFSEVRHSIIGNHCSIARGATIDHTVLGEGCQLGPNTSITSGPATVPLEGLYLQVPRMGAILGDDCTVGAHGALLPGVLVGNGSTIAPMRVVRDSVPDHARVL